MIQLIFWFFTAYMITTTWLYLYYSSKYDELKAKIDAVNTPEQQLINAKRVLDERGYDVIVRAVLINNYEDIKF